jgi:hypothetical protein
MIRISEALNGYDGSVSANADAFSQQIAADGSSGQVFYFVCHRDTDVTPTGAVDANAPPLLAQQFAACPGGDVLPRRSGRLRPGGENGSRDQTGYSHAIERRDVE